MKNIKLNNVDFVETLIEKIREKFCNEDFIPKIISTVYEDIIEIHQIEEYSNLNIKNFFKDYTLTIHLTNETIYFRKILKNKSIRGFVSTNNIPNDLISLFNELINNTKFEILQKDF